MFFERIGVYGLAEVEDLLWAGALTGDPVLLVGSAGSAKTKIIEAMGKVLRMRTKVYNCAAINFEDLIGYVLPNKEGTEMEIIPSPYAIHDVEVLGLDEISRTRVDRQNDMLSIIRERRIQGKMLNDLKIIIGAMNPIQDVDGDSYEGAEPLDKAFAERFSTTIFIKPFLEMEQEDQSRIITATGTGDAVSLKFWKDHNTANTVAVAPAEATVVADVLKNQAPDQLEALSKEVYDMLGVAAQSYEHYNSTWNEAITNYIKEFAAALGKGEKGRRMSGRMAGMIYRNILSLAAINKAMAPDLNIKMEDIAYKSVLHSFPDISYSDAVDEGKIFAAHKLAKHHLSGLVEELSLAEIKKETDPVQRVYRALNGVKIGSQDLSTLIKESLDELKEKNPVKANMFAHTVFYEIQDKDFIQATVLVELGKEIRRLGLIKNNSSNYGSKSSSTGDLNTKVQKNAHDGLKEMLVKAKSEEEKTLMIKSALIYSEMYSDLANLKDKDIKPLETMHNEFVKMLKQFQGVSKKAKVKV